MGNLGRYQDIVTEAKSVGGVDAWIKVIEDAAAAERSSTSFAKGLGVGVLVASVAAGGAGALRLLWVQKRERRALMDEARAQLRAEIEEPETSMASGNDRVRTESVPVASTAHDSHGDIQTAKLMSACDD